MTAASIAGLLPTLVMPEPEWNPPITPTVSADTEDSSCDEESVRLMLLVKEGDVKAFEKLVEEKSFNPTFVTHVPKELVPLAKQNTADDSVVDVYELIINGQEISPGYSELNDPLVQRQRLLDGGGVAQRKDAAVAAAHAQMLIGDCRAEVRLRGGAEGRGTWALFRC